jgi:phytoene synthase
MEYLKIEHEIPKTVIPRHLEGTAGRRSSNLALALLLLPRARRHDAFLFHDFCRLVDDIADSSSITNEEKQTILNDWLSALELEKAHTLPRDFSEMILRRDLDLHLLREIIRGMLMDTAQNRFAKFDDLYLYCWRVASAVGLTSARIFGAEGASVTHYAEELGIALQLTNILRDVAEDAAMNRIYLPQEDLVRFGVSDEQILSSVLTPQMTHLLNYQAERADSYFAKAELAWSAMSVNQHRLMRPARLMSAIYRDLLLAMHRDRYDVFHHRYRVGRIKKLLHYFFLGC